MESKERISIKNFAGIEELEMDIKPINILIGPQGVGKSVVVKLIYFFKGLNDKITAIGAFSQKNEFSLQEIIKSAFYEYFDEEVIGSTYFRIEYITYEGESFLLENIYGEGIKFTSSINIDRLIDDLIDVNQGFQKLASKNQENDFLLYLEIKRDLTNILRKTTRTYLGVSRPPVFIPSGRSFFSTVKSNIFTLIEDNSSLDSFIVEFGSLFEALKKSKYVEKNNDEVENLIQSVLNGVFVREDSNKEYILHKDNRKVQLQSLSSGQQEALPLMLVLKAIIEKKLYKTGCALYIEEPEAHLFPTAQKAIVGLLAKTYNSNPDNIQLFITTHSPYILTSFNNLIYAGNIIKDDESKREAVEKVIIAKDTLLDCSQIGAYALTRDGLKDLIDQENHIINAELLDDVSNVIGREFDQLLDIEFD